MLKTSEKMKVIKQTRMKLWQNSRYFLTALTTSGNFREKNPLVSIMFAWHLRRMWRIIRFWWIRILWEEDNFELICGYARKNRWHSPGWIDCLRFVPGYIRIQKDKRTEGINIYTEGQRTWYFTREVSAKSPWWNSRFAGLDSHFVFHCAALHNALQLPKWQWCPLPPVSYWIYENDRGKEQKESLNGFHMC